ncbi:unnamed protein product [Ambrosiozyma monospora]|uniref:Unnamed protein product n=1 Tax=Ambrosiozyma monospora TaxID=43982 RepID=A0ACB5TC67_AMBMO|nr:unnamed protein product [Ambrosiozyma monospora]
MPVVEFNKQVMANVQAHAHESFFYRYILRPNCFPVKGTPWIEDLGRYPSSRIKIGFEGPDLTEESLYMLFRRYGRISDIVLPAPDAKPRVAVVQFRLLGSGICARHCITGMNFEDTILHIQYTPYIKPNAFLEFIKTHQKISIPIILALLAGIAVLIFDPIRLFFAKEKITGEYSISQNETYQKLSRSLGRMFSRVQRAFGGEKSSLNGAEGLWNDRSQNIEQVKLWLEENVNTFIVVQGPSGSGKRDMVEQNILKDRENVLYVNCENLTNARKDKEFINNFAKEFGYFPVFAWLSTAEISPWMNTIEWLMQLLKVVLLQ